MYPAFLRVVFFVCLLIWARASKGRRNLVNKVFRGWDALTPHTYSPVSMSSAKWELLGTTLTLMPGREVAPLRSHCVALRLLGKGGVRKSWVPSVTSGSKAPGLTQRNPLFHCQSEAGARIPAPAGLKLVSEDGSPGVSSAQDIGECEPSLSPQKGQQMTTRCNGRDPALHRVLLGQVGKGLCQMVGSPRNPGRDGRYRSWQAGMDHKGVRCSPPELPLPETILLTRGALEGCWGQSGAQPAEVK